MVTKVATREAFGKTLVELGHGNPNIVVIGGDLNKSTMTSLFAKEFPDRFFDCGAAEQNMMGIASGLAASGKISFASTFAVFGSGRPFDQIRISIAQARANVKIVVTHAGIITGPDGMSAHGIEDLALMCSLVGFTVVVPADAAETVQAVRAMAEMDGPCYLRLSRPATPIVCPGRLPVPNRQGDGIQAGERRHYHGHGHNGGNGPGSGGGPGPGIDRGPRRERVDTQAV